MSLTDQNQIYYVYSATRTLDSLLGFLIIHLLVTFEMKLLKDKLRHVKIFLQFI